MWLLRCAAVVLVAAVLPAVTASDARAFFTHVERVQAMSATTSEAKSVSVSCPAGKRVVGAGAQVFFSGGVLVTAIRPDAALTSVTARAREDEDGTASNWQVAAYAICAPPPAGLQRVAVTSASTSAAKSAVAGCPAGKRLLGTGGEVVASGGQVLLDALRPDQPLTQATAGAVEDEDGTAASWTVTAYAICSSPVAGLQRVPASSAADSTAFKSVGASCPPGKVLVGTGGAVSAPDGQVLLSQLSPAPDLTGLGAAALEDDTGTGANWRVTGYGVCAAQAQLVSSTSPRTTANFLFWQAVCPEGMTAIGYGGQLMGGLGEARLRSVRSEDLGFVQVLGSENDDERFYSVTAHAVCTTPIAGAVIVTATSAPDSTALPRVATVPCPAGTRVVGAGGEAVDSDTGHIGLLEAVRPDPALTSVTAEGRPDFASPEWQVRAWAVCAPPPPGLQRVVAESEPGFDIEVATVVARCPAGKHLLGTGGDIVGGQRRVGFDDLRPDAALTRTTVVATQDSSLEVTDWFARAYAICVNR